MVHLLPSVYISKIKPAVRVLPEVISLQTQAQRAKKPNL